MRCLYCGKEIKESASAHEKEHCAKERDLNGKLDGGIHFNGEIEVMENG